MNEIWTRAIEAAFDSKPLPAFSTLAEVAQSYEADSLKLVLDILGIKYCAENISATTAHIGHYVFNLNYIHMRKSGDAVDGFELEIGVTREGRYYGAQIGTTGFFHRFIDSLPRRALQHKIYVLMQALDEKYQTWTWSESE